MSIDKLILRIGTLYQIMTMGLQPLSAGSGMMLRQLAVSPLGEDDLIKHA